MLESNKSLILIGYSGHGLIVAEAAMMQGFTIQGFTDLSEKNKNPLNLKYLGDENAIDFPYWEKKMTFIIGIGDNQIRKKIFELISIKKCETQSIIHPNSHVSKYSFIGDGVMIARNACVNPMATIRNNVIINTGSIIEHECIVGAHTHIAPGAVLAGNVAVGENGFIGANSVVKQGVSIASNVFIGAGSVVVNNIVEKGTYVGNPLRKIK